MKTLIAGAIFFFSSLVAGDSISSEIGYSEIPKFGITIGSKFPLDDLKSEIGQDISTEAYLGKNLLINFFLTDCAPCVWEVPILNQIRERRPDLNFLAITSDSNLLTAKYIRKYGLRWPVALGSKSLFIKQLGVQAYPSFALVDPRGNLISTIPGYLLADKDGRTSVKKIETWVAFEISKSKK